MEERMSCIMLVDDQPLTRRFLSEELSAFGHALIYVDNPDDVLESIKDSAPDIVLLNILLHNFEGWDLVREIKLFKPSLPVLIFSIYESLKDDPRAAQADARVIHDFGTEKMIREINSLLDGIKAQSKEDRITNTNPSTISTRVAAMDNELRRKNVILMADDDQDDYFFLKDALTAAEIPVELHLVPDGQELMDYLHHYGKYADPVKHPSPALILLDINMPRKDGLETLAEIRTTNTFYRVPIVMYTTSGDEKDIYEAYSLGADSFITKPVTNDSMTSVVERIEKYITKSAPLSPNRRRKAPSGVGAEMKSPPPVRISTP
jgi:DNA-binding response OmpR family regulator